MCVSCWVTMGRLRATRATSHCGSFSTVCFLPGQHLGGRASLLSASGARSRRGWALSRLSQAFRTQEPRQRSEKDQRFLVHWGVAGRDCLGPVVCTTPAHITHTHYSHTTHHMRTHTHTCTHTITPWHPFTGQSHTQLNLCRAWHVLLKRGRPFPAFTL